MTQNEHKAAFACITSPDNRALVIMGNRPTQGNRVEFPGGTKEADDSSATVTALREASEETNITLDEDDVTHEAWLAMPGVEAEKIAFVVVRLGHRAFRAIDLSHRGDETEGMFVLPLREIIELPPVSTSTDQLAIYDTQRVIAAVSLGLVLGAIENNHGDNAREPYVSPFLRKVLHKSGESWKPTIASVVR